MESDEVEKYLKEKSEYKVKGIKKHYFNFDNKKNIEYLSEKIRNVAKDGLSGQISPSFARKEILDMLENINELKKGRI
jgi:hypothetical protein